MPGLTVICLYSGWSEFHPITIVCDFCNLHSALKLPVAVCCDASAFAQFNIQPKGPAWRFLQLLYTTSFFPVSFRTNSSCPQTCCFLYLVRRLLSLWVPLPWVTVWKLHRQEAEMNVEHISHISFLSRSQPYVVCCPMPTSSCFIYLVQFYSCDDRKSFSHYSAWLQLEVPMSSLSLFSQGSA